MTENLPESKTKKTRYFTEAQTDLSAVLGGPIPAGIIFYKNFMTLNRPKDALFSLLVSFIFTVLLFVALIKLPPEVMDKVPNFVFTAFYGIITAILYRKLLKKDIENLDEEVYTRASNWAVAGYTALGIVLFLLTVFFIAISQPTFPGEVVKVGNTKNEIYYQGNVSKDNIQLLANTLNDLGYFSEETANAAQIKSEKKKFTVTILVKKDFWDNPDIQSAIMILKSELVINYSKDVIIVLEDYDLMGNKSAKEF